MTQLDTDSIEPVTRLDSEVILKTEGLCKSYGQKKVVNQVSLEVRTGEVVGLLGPNSAGKSTTFNMVVGLCRQDAGKIFFKGADVSQVAMYKRARLGMGYLPQSSQAFYGMTASENIMAVLETLDLTRAERKQRLDELLAELGLTRCANQTLSSMSGGEKRRLEITRTLATSPNLLLFDEPFAGVDPHNVIDVQEVIYQLVDKGYGVLITDHNVHETLKIVDVAYIINQGTILAMGAPDFLKNRKEVQEAYLGGSHEVERKFRDRRGGYSNT